MTTTMRAAATGLALVALLAGCSGSGGTTTTAAKPAPTVTVTQQVTPESCKTAINLAAQANQNSAEVFGHFADFLQSIQDGHAMAGMAALNKALDDHTGVVDELTAPYQEARDACLAGVE